MELQIILTFALMASFSFLSSIPSFSSLKIPNEPQSAAARRRLVAERSIESQATAARLVSQYLQPHNAVRAKLGLRPFEWSQELADYASRWARERREDCELVHSEGDYGENLFWGSGNKWRPRDAVRAWAGERRFYDVRARKCRPNRDCLHYTQMVWRTSLRIGCAKVVCKSGDTFITCNYDPHGNVVGQKPY